MPIIFLYCFVAPLCYHREPQKIHFQRKSLILSQALRANSVILLGVSENLTIKMSLKRDVLFFYINSISYEHGIIIAVICFCKGQLK